MKEYVKNNIVTYNLITFTGFKSLIIFTLLLDGPKSYEEICEHFVAHPHLKEKISIDTLRVYITSLKRSGCEIVREKIDKVSKYKIVSHPFELNISTDQIQSIVKIYKNVIKNVEIKELILLENFLDKLQKFTNNEELINAHKNISIFKDINKELLLDLLDCCERKDQIVISYNSPNSGTKDIEIIADKLDFSNNKLYLYGTGFEYMQYGTFLIQRIQKIKEIKEIKTIPSGVKEIKVGYEVNVNTPNLRIENNEKIVQENEDKLIIEITSSNEFLIKQKLLFYGPECKIIYPESFKQDFVAKLQEMKEGYFGE